MAGGMPEAVFQYSLNVIQLSDDQKQLEGLLIRWRYWRKDRNESHTDNCSAEKEGNSKENSLPKHRSVSNTAREESQGDTVKRCCTSSHFINISRN